MVAQRAFPAGLGKALLRNAQRVPCNVGSSAVRGLASGAGSGKWALPKNEANFTALSPLSFLKRVERVQPDTCSVIHGSKTFTWGQTAQRSRQLASALVKLGVKPGDTVAVVASNTPEMLELHWAVPMVGAVINAINTRVSAQTMAYILNHGEASVLFTDTEFAGAVGQALKIAGRTMTVVDICDDQVPEYNVAANRLSKVEYEDFIAGMPAHDVTLPEDEWDAIALSYTSGTTGNPKGVVTHHRGAYLASVGNILGWEMPRNCTYLWTLPMFHCNGWVFPWALAQVAGTNVCLRKVTAPNIYNAIADQKVTHMCGAPIVLNTIAQAPKEHRREFSHQVKVMTAAAPPPPRTLQQMQEQGFDVLHVYGLTETYGPAVVCEWKQEWNSLSTNQQAKIRSRQGVNYPVLEDLQVMDPETMIQVPADGETMGEVMMRGNMVMKGYLDNDSANSKDLKGGWYHSGDLGVMHPDGYIELKDRSKDIIISGGENISSIEIEAAIFAHPSVNLAAVVAKPDDKWGEVPCAFIEFHKGQEVSVEVMIAHCRKNLAGFMVPKAVVFAEISKTSTGKVQKFKMREIAKETPLLK